MYLIIEKEKIAVSIFNCVYIFFILSFIFFIRILLQFMIVRNFHNGFQLIYKIFSRVRNKNIGFFFTKVLLKNGANILEPNY